MEVHKRCDECPKPAKYVAKPLKLFSEGADTLHIRRLCSECAKRTAWNTMIAAPNQLEMYQWQEIH